jgi:hypothetical protein
MLQDGALSAPEGAVVIGEVLALWLNTWEASPAQRALLCETVTGTADLMLSIGHVP